MRTYNHEQLTAMYLAAWSDDDFAVFSYPPMWRRRFEAPNDTTNLIIDFKDNVPAAVDLVIQWATHAFRANDPEFRQRNCRYVVSAPRSTAGVPNAAAERLGAALAQEFEYLVHLPDALVRTATVAASHLGERASIEQHVETMAYRGPVLSTPDATGFVCRECAKKFKGGNGLGWHYEHIHRLPPTTPSATASHASFLLVDDIITNGRTSAAARTVLRSATSVPDTVGFFVGRTIGH